MQEQLTRSKEVRIAGYVILFTTQTMGKKTSKLGIFFAGNSLIPLMNFYGLSSEISLAGVASEM